MQASSGSRLGHKFLDRICFRQRALGNHNESGGRLRKKPVFRAAACRCVALKDIRSTAPSGARLFTQAGLYTAKCRLLEAREASLPRHPWNREGGGCW